MFSSKCPVSLIALVEDLSSSLARVEKVLEVAPHLNIILGDVRKLPFEDDSFDGY